MRKSETKFNTSWRNRASETRKQRRKTEKMKKREKTSSCTMGLHRNNNINHINNINNDNNCINRTVNGGINNWLINTSDRNYNLSTSRNNKSKHRKRKTIWLTPPFC